MDTQQLPEPIDFDWDAGNQTKSLIKHGITTREVEETFFNFKHALPDNTYSSTEARFVLYGQTNAKKILFISFTIRRSKVRVISARTANKKERKLYEEASKKVA